MDTAVVLLLSGATILLWSMSAFTLPTLFGDLGIVSLCFLALAFGSNLLTEVDLNSFSWQTLILLGGSSVLGKAVTASQLLNRIVSNILPFLPTNPAFLSFSVFTFAAGCATFVSHSVAAIILVPIIVDIAAVADEEQGAGGVLFVSLSICSAFAISAAMTLPFSSFPNVNSLMVMDDHKETYLKTKDFFIAGLPASIIAVLCIQGLGMRVCAAVFGS
eukprot:CAMPEP_0185755358 /NCGR_PEP_ID=MMETSP1174-20130828/13865_1 /TAXON_ID=35687 /ORGANISM="Dictyocha speculum, Strain CCMP1381" /LENGTH=217 /DNA_ID=CAMNT_0028433877 /DNA_START=182 /DNA_END=835 /DNA_ORIENTATION=-